MSVSPPTGRVVVVPPEPLSPRMGGAGWRAFDLAGSLSAFFRTTLLAPPGSVPPEPAREPGLDAEAPAIPGPTLEVMGRGSPASRLEPGDVLVTQGTWISPLRDGRKLEQVRLVLDLYDPLPVELAFHYRTLADRGRADRRYRFNLRRTGFLAAQADTVLVANSPQRDLVLGLLAGTSSLDPGEVVAGPTLAGRILDLPSAVAEPIVPSTVPTQRWLAWGGGPWTWFDARSALLVAAELHAEDERYALVVPGAPPPGAAGHLSADGDLLARARAAGLAGTAVRSTGGWLDRDRYRALLAECRVGLCLAPRSLESRFAHRTRVLDFLAAGLPCVATGDDPLTLEGAREGWARVVEPGDLDALRAAVRALAEDGPEREAARQALFAARGSRVWWRTVRPLVERLRQPAAARRGPSWPLSALLHQLRRLGG